MARRKSKSRIRTRRTFITILAAALLFTAIYIAEQYYRLEVCNFESIDHESHGYYIYPNAPVDSVLTIIAADYDIANRHDWKKHCRTMLFTTARAGYYELPRRFGDKHLINRLQLGRETPVRLTWTNQVRTREQLAQRLSRQLLLDSASISRCLNSNEFMANYGLNRETAICLFLPNTYEVYWSLSAEQLFDRMHKEYRKFWTEERLTQASEIGLSPSQVATLASIVESETNNRAEHAVIAGLYMNRLHKGMALQACPTVIFANGDFSIRRVTGHHTSIDSPYNTYRYRGLPPGPIRCANAVTLDAVLHYDHNNYLYMCANPDFSGTHVFSSTYAQHSATARRYQRELNRRKIH